MLRQDAFRDEKWGCFEAEVAPVKMVADLAYLGAQLYQVERMVGKKVSSTAIRRLMNLLSPNMRMPAGMRRSGGRPRSSRSINRLSGRHRGLLIGMLGDYHSALLAGADMADARLAAWLVFDAERQAGVVEAPDGLISLDVWLLFIDLLVKRRAVVCRCGVCGGANLVLDLDSGLCAHGGHKAVDAGPYFLSPDGTESPALRDISG